MSIIFVVTRTGALSFGGGSFDLIRSLVLSERQKKTPLRERDFDSLI